MDYKQKFSKGKLPQGLNGFYKGELLEMYPLSFVEKLAYLVTKFYLPWFGKTFFVSSRKGDNRLPFFSHTFSFKTYSAKSIDGNNKVLVLDYNLESNPGIVRRVIDEVVEIGDNQYIGKAFVKGKKGRKPRLLAYFGLKK
jgi:hypothetical protein